MLAPRLAAGGGGGGGGGGGTPTWADYIGVCAYLTSDFPALQALGIQHIRTDMPSSTFIESARTYGIETLPIAAYCPWSDLNGGHTDKYPPTSGNMATWATRMVDTWRSMATPPTVFECWNEPWLVNFWQPAPDPAAYFALVQAFTAEVWAEWPTAVVLVSADEGFSGNFRQDVLAADTAGLLTDARIRPVTHNYCEDRSPIAITGDPCRYDFNRYACAYIDYLAHGHADPQVWVTEYGWESLTTGGDPEGGATVTEAQQSSYTTDALLIMRSSSQVEKTFCFEFRGGDVWDYNWLRPDGSQKPVCGAVAALIASGV